MENKVENQMLEMMKQMTDRMEKGFATVDTRLGEIDASIKYHTEILGGVAEKIETEATNSHTRSAETKKDIDYLTYKLNQLDKELFIIRNQP
ncbi:MAG: hypothetical protein IMZ40_00150 [Bacilli bacterium]|nr:hypothetical protein [Bacilli bacterium]